MLVGSPGSPAGELDGVTLLSPRTVAWMTSDHLGTIARGNEYIPGAGYGFGLGVAQAG